MVRGIIYLIINKENGHKYIGQTTQAMNKRWQQHIVESRKMSQKPLHRAFRKYGIDKFTIKEIDECDEHLLNEKEEYWIKHYNTFESADGYNATSGGDKVVFNEETKTKISEKLSNIERTSEWVENIKTSLKEKAIRESWGCLTDKNRGNGKHSGLRVQGIHIETGEMKEWENARIAAADVAGDPNKNSNILLSARKGYKCYGYKWKILEEKSKKKAVFAIDKKTGFIGPKYESIAEASREMGNQTKGTGLIKSLRNPGRYSWKGFYWYYDLL
jgi:group I intron endonuclease